MSAKYLKLPKRLAAQGSSAYLKSQSSDLVISFFTDIGIVPSLDTHYLDDFGTGVGAYDNNDSVSTYVTTDVIHYVIKVYKTVGGVNYFGADYATLDYSVAIDFNQVILTLPAAPANSPTGYLITRSVNGGTTQYAYTIDGSGTTFLDNTNTTWTDGDPDTSVIFETVLRWKDPISNVTITEETMESEFLIDRQNTLNGFPTMVLNANQWMATDVNALPTQAKGWWLGVVKISGTGNNEIVDTRDSGGGRQMIYLDSSRKLHAYCTTNQLVTTVACPFDTWMIVGAIFNGADSFIGSSGGGDVVTGNIFVDPLSDLKIGAGIGSDAPMTGRLAGIVRGNTGITWAQLKARADVLATKYSISSLPAYP